MAEEASGFLGRWARRKTDALQGKPLDEPAAAPPWVADGVGAKVPAAVPAESRPAPADVAEPPEKKLLSLDDVKLLTKDSDFKPFMASDVGPEVRNAAMKRLFTDPHFNVMDGLDTYVDDYSKSDPIPESMLRQMVGAKFLQLFDDEDDGVKAAPASSPRESANAPMEETVAQSNDNRDPAIPQAIDSEQPSQPESLTDSGASQENHAQAELRLQSDHSAAAPDAGRGPP